jgi:hypothetical protein
MNDLRQGAHRPAVWPARRATLDLERLLRKLRHELFVRENFSVDRGGCAIQRCIDIRSVDVRKWSRAGREAVQTKRSSLFPCSYQAS